MTNPDRTARRTQANAALRAEFANADAENISYDFFKNMVSLSVVTLGGVLGLSEGVFGERIALVPMMIASGLIALSGMVALQCQSDIMQVARGCKEPSYWLRWGHRLVTGLFGAGVGAFLFLVSGIDLG